MSTTDLTTRDHINVPAVNERGTAMIMRAVEQMAGAGQLATALAGTSFVPAHFRGKADDVAAAIMYGAAIGLDPMSSLRAIYVVNGTPGLYARQMVAIAQAAGHKVWTEHSTDDAVTVAGHRKGDPEHVETVTWTIARAEKAGYTKNAKYKSDPQAMLWARAASDVVRRIASDALAGLDVSYEELQVIDAVDVTARPRRESVTDLLAQASGAPAPVEHVEAVVVPDTEPADEQPITITDKTRRHLFAAMKDVGLIEKTAQLAWISEALGRPFDTRTGLTEDDGRALIIELENLGGAA